MTTFVCNDCGQPVSVTNRSITFPFVCEKCQAETEKFQADIAPANATLGKLMTEPSVLETPSKETVDTALLISDLAQQLNETTVERDRLIERTVQQANDIRVLSDRVIAKDTQVANQAGTIERLEAQTELTTSYAVQLANELAYAARRLFSLAAENGKLEADLKLVTEERESAYASELALHNKLAQYIKALDERKKEVKYQTMRAYTFKRDAVEQWKKKVDLKKELRHPWRNLWKFYQDKVR